MSCLPFLGNENITRADLISKNRNQRGPRNPETSSIYIVQLVYCSLFAIAWSISLLSAARCSAELMAPTMGSPTMLPF